MGRGQIRHVVKTHSNKYLLLGVAEYKIMIFMKSFTEIVNFMILNAAVLILRPGYISHIIKDS